VPTNPSKRRISLALACLTAASLAACEPSDAGEASGTRVPEAGAPAGAGAAIGTAVALATRGGSASIKQGSKITVTLDQRLELPPSW